MQKGYIIQHNTPTQFRANPETISGNSSFLKFVDEKPYIHRITTCEQIATTNNNNKLDDLF